MQSALMTLTLGGSLFALVAGDPQARGADDRMRFSLSIYSGREDPSWEPNAEEVKKFTAKFDTLKVKDPQVPLNSVLGYRGFAVEGFRSYDWIWVRNGTRRSVS